MSFDALAWAGKCKPGSASRKLVLMALADRHNTETNICFPSVDWLCDWTDLNRKTVINATRDLEGAGFIRDTGQRKGRTGQVKVYSLALDAPGADVPENHYVYRLEGEGGEYYIGVRSFVGDIERDRYMGSGRWPEAMRATEVALAKSIVSNHTTRTDAEIAEALAIKAAIGDPLCRNIEYKDTAKSIPETGPLKSTVSSAEQSQKRDTDTVREPIPPVATQQSDSEREASPKDLIPEVVEAWQQTAERYGLPLLRGSLNAERRKKLLARLREHPIEDWRDAFAAFGRSEFLRGETGNWRGATFDFLLSPKTFQRTIEGTYDDPTH